MKQIELLSPAKDLECGIAAIKCGADAVYIGAGKFGARASAGNNIEDIKKLIQFAHFYRAKVYVTVNTILNDNEIEQAQKLIKKLYEICADAIIIQDMGLLELDLPPVPIFASTQCHNSTSEKVKFLEQAGFSRVILARELSLEQIKEIRFQSDIELESFIHGALCVSYSGQCYMSYANGGRSGNKGECAQPCRKQYELVDSNNKVISDKKHLLSLKDLNLSNHIKDLIDAGITSFKIEGRLKDINYIKNIVSFYRTKIDEVLEGTRHKKSSSGNVFIDFVPDFSKTFNRGHSEYFINGRKKEITSSDTPKFKGEGVGKITKIFKDSFILDKKPEVIMNNGDGISFFDQQGNLCGTVINNVDDNRIYPNIMNFLQVNTYIYRNLDHEFIKKIKNSKIERKIQLNLWLSETPAGLILHAIDEDGIEANASIDTEKEIAKNPQMAIDNIKKQLLKLGETDFICSDIEINLKNSYFIRIKDLNELRRTLIEKLEQNRINSYERQNRIITKNDYQYHLSELTFEGNVLNSYAEKFYTRHGVKAIEPAAESGLDMKDRKIMTTKHCLKYQFDLCPKHDLVSRQLCQLLAATTAFHLSKVGFEKFDFPRKSKFSRTLEKNKSDFQAPFYLVDDQNKKYLLKFNCKRCEMEIYLNFTK
ncbi:MAG: U32 family peptidase [Candidatus Gastranaerophilales bacterium]|nr:U32 family peptidase [Candidatus Gastranaerophilales bacterium]